MFEDRRRAESFGADPDRYDRARPTYPAAAVERITEGWAPGSRVLDVGCGTGILARLLAGRGASVLGVEVDPRMAEVARRKGTPVELGAFEGWDPAGRRFDAVVSGQAWHWIDPARGPVAAAGVLEPGGGLWLCWNLGEPPPDLAAAWKPIYERLAPGADSHSVLLGHRPTGRFEAIADGIAACPSLSPPAAERFGWEQTYTTAEWCDQLPTHSDHAALPPARLDQLLDEVAGTIDDGGGGLTMRYQTLVVSAVRTA